MGKPVKKAVMFVGLTFLVNWSLALLFFALGGRWYSPVGMAVGAAYMFVPMAVAIGVQRGIYREPVREPLGISFRLNRWFLVAWLLPLVIATAQGACIPRFLAVFRAHRIHLGPLARAPDPPRAQRSATQQEGKS